MSVFKKHDNESFDDFYLRLRDIHFNDETSWKDIADEVNFENGWEVNSNSIRKRVEKSYNLYNSAKHTVHISEQSVISIATDDDDDVDIEKYNKLIRKSCDRQMLADERLQLNAYIRSLSRESSLTRLAEEIVEKRNYSNPFKYEPIEVVNDSAEALLILSDWHYGIDFKNAFNEYNPDVAYNRLLELISVTLNFCKKRDITTLNIFNLGDLVSGRIHLPLRIQNRLDLMEQVISVCDLLEMTLNEFRRNGLCVKYYDCLDNHSRVEPNKSNSIDSESVVKFITYFLQKRFMDVDGINIMSNNEFGNDIITTDILGHHIGGVHGDKDAPGKVVDNLTLLTGNKFDLVCTAHLHHFSCDEQNECVVISNPSLMGTDEYARGLRLSSKAGQMLIKITRKYVCDEIMRVVLN